jgi:transcriptional regulator with XRE-family HTH domain
MDDSKLPKRRGTRPVPPINRARLGRALREVRLAAGKTTRQVEGFSTSHVSNVENGHVMPSEAMVAAYVEMGGDTGRLLALLEKSRRSRPGTSHAERPWIAKLADPHTDPRVLRRGYLIEKIADTYLLGPEGQSVANSHRVTIRPLSDRTRYFPFRQAYDEDPRRGVSVVEPGSGCTMPVFEESDNGTVYAVIGFHPDNCTADGVYELEWTIRFNTDVRTRSQASAGTSSLVPRASVEVTFDPSCLPKAVWWFRASDPLAGSMSPPARNVFAPGDARRYSHDFRNLEEEWWGLGWSWPTT